jgi:hypothetical protein
MNEHLKDRIIRKLETLNDERGYQLLDYVEFLESKFAERQTPTGNAFTRFTDAVEDRLRAGKVSAAAIAETMGLLNRAANVLNGAVAAGRSVASDIVTAAQSASTPKSSGTTGATPASPPVSPPSAPAQPKETLSPPSEVPQPGSGEERL